MNKRSIIYILGWVLIVDAVAMQIGTITSLIYGEKEAWYFVLTGVVSAILGVLAIKVKKPKNMVLYQKAGFASTALSWILLSLVGCMPFFPCRGYSGMAAAFSVALAAFCSKTAKTAARSKSSPSFRAVMGFVLSGVR